MEVRDQGFTISEYCSQMSDGKIIVNKDYQRSSLVWVESAQSYLIDTILHGYPISKLTLALKTDLKSRKTHMEIVDGQQRSNAILRFFRDELKLAGKSHYRGLRFGDLDEDAQARFIGYQLTADLFVEATDEEIRDMFRRINSHTVPLNDEEQRHATHQGDFKWFILSLMEAHASLLKHVGAFGERQLIRMQDAKLFTELVLAAEEGIRTYAKKNLDDIYERYEQGFPDETLVRAAVTDAVGWLGQAETIHKGALMKPYNLYSLLLARMHQSAHIEALEPIYGFGSDADDHGAEAVARLSELQDALEVEKPKVRFRPFVDACKDATNTLKNRQMRFRWFCAALEGKQP